jgi:hypothetical protein
MIALIAFALAVDAGTIAAPPAAVEPVKTGPLRDAKSILADYARAIGSEKSWKKHRTVKIRREVVVKAMHFTSREETRIARGGKIYSSSEMPGMGTFLRGCDGRTAWASDPIGGLRILKGAEAEDVRIAAAWNSEWRLAQVYGAAHSVPVPEGAPSDLSLECVQLDKSKGKPTVLCFDAKTHLRAWEQGVQASQGGEVPYVTRYSDWRLVDGVKVWYQEDVTVGPVTMEGHIVEISFDEHFPATLFSLPKR